MKQKKDPYVLVQADETGHSTSFVPRTCFQRPWPARRPRGPGYHEALLPPTLPPSPPSSPPLCFLSSLSSYRFLSTTFSNLVNVYHLLLTLCLAITCIQLMLRNIRGANDEFIYILVPRQLRLIKNKYSTRRWSEWRRGQRRPTATLPPPSLQWPDKWSSSVSGVGGWRLSWQRPLSLSGSPTFCRHGFYVLEAFLVRVKKPTRGVRNSRETI